MATASLLFLSALGANETPGSMASEILYSWSGLGTLSSFIVHPTDPSKPVQSALTCTSASQVILGGPYIWVRVVFTMKGCLKA